MEAQEDSGLILDMPSVTHTSAVDVFTHIKIVDSIIQKLKKVRAIIVNQMQSQNSSVDG